MAKKKSKLVYNPQPGWAVYLRTSSDENQKPEMSRARQRFAIEENVLKRSEMPIYSEYIDVLTGTTPLRKDYQRMLEDARAGKFSHVIVERADRFGRNDTEALRAIDELWEFGVAVRFANQPDLDPQDPDDRVIVALSFTLARRESALLGIRVIGGLRAKRESGGFPNYAPDGYVNVTGKVIGEAKKFSGRHETWIEQDPERAPIIRYAFDLLLQDRLSLEGIAEELHARGYRYRTGRPFVQFNRHGQRKVNTNTLCSIFHNWAYAGWLTSEAGNIPPKTIRGQWEPIVTTEEFERGLLILEKRSQKLVRHRKHDYLLKGIAYYEHPDGSGLQRLTGSTSNAGRSSGGTSYYRLARTDVAFLCEEIDCQIPNELMQVQVDPVLVPAIRAVYTHDVMEKLGHIRPDEREELLATLKAVNEEENRTARLFAAGKISEIVWDSMWREWQDRRNKIHVTLATLEQKQETHIANLDTALEMITRVGVVYNGLQRSDQKELLRHMVARVVINDEGSIRLELRAPFSYLQDIRDAVRNEQAAEECNEGIKKETGEDDLTGSPRVECSLTTLSCGKDWITFEHLSPLETTQFLDSLPFPQRESLAPFITNPN
jgi:DNA invertase Pin-like site-specific DNA recombinase